ncbi:MAG: dipeptidase, partial [Bacteroidales bacterium]
AVAQADANALKMDNKAIGYLTQFSVNEANALFDKWKQLDKYLLVKYIDGNTKKQESDGAFTTNGHSNRVPVTPNFPGYTEKFKKAIKEDTGNRLLVK